MVVDVELSEEVAMDDVDDDVVLEVVDREVVEGSGVTRMRPVIEAREIGPFTADPSLTVGSCVP